MTIAGIKVFGTIYRCRLRHVHIEEMDPLSTFIFNTICKAPQNARIDALTHSFGLSRRIVENVLADLIRTRRASLDIARGTIVPMADAPPSTAVYEDHGTLDVWQDHVTGAILPAWLVMPYYKEIETSAEILRAAGDDFESFLDVSDASLLTLLTRIDPALAFSLDGSWRLDRFVSRVRLGSEALYVPLRSIWLDGDERVSVDASDLPVWLTKAWLGRVGRASTPPLAVSAAAAPVHELSIPDSLKHAQLRLYAKRWLDSAEEILDLTPPPEVVQDIRTFNDTIGNLQQRLLTLASFAMTETPPTAQALSVTVGADEGPVSAATAANIHIVSPTDHFVVMDSMRLCLPLVDEAPVRWLVITSSDVCRAVQQVLYRLDPDCGEGLLGLHRRAAIHNRRREVQFVDGLTVHDALDQLSDFRRQLSLAMQERRLHSRDEAVSAGDSLVRAAEDVPKTSLRTSNPRLAARLDGLRSELQKPLPPGYSAYAFVERYELMELLELLVGQQPGESNICRIVSPLSEEAFDDAVIDALNMGIALGWKIHIHVPASDDQISYASRLHLRVASVHLRIFSLPVHCLLGLAVVNDLAIVGSFKLLADRVPGRVERSFAIVLQDQTISDAFFHGSATWPELSPST